MANANTEIDLGELHAGIESAIRAQFPALKLVEFYREEEERKPPTVDQMPACLLELSEMEPTPDVDPGTEQLAVNARFEARLVIGFRTPRAKLEIRKLAAALAVFLRLKRWPHPTIAGKTIPTGPAEVTSIVPDNFNPELDRYEVWRVEWLQPLHLGTSIWKDEGVTPQTPLYSFKPDIGAGNTDQYLNAAPDAAASGGGA
ncbi:hypothetical protein [Microvirga sp. 17 mud 1-3]|uniref:hypothetical protein n=1 Tax=Microvirga sp. 17 mud 1-3 TaxID=2082949 RepID=UPI000D6CCB1A|nr:hypothetical protein [Microvirga sp. 17 mud 1-3]AWM87371.1 hypothetical protein C4E04_11930 [Microvirga sp. 17 mud 1-3]